MFTKAIALIAAITSIASAQNAFTYQGVLNDNGAPADGNYDMRFSVWTDATVGPPDTLIGSIFTSPATPVVDGLFTVNLDLDDAAFQTNALRFIEIQVRFDGDPLYTTLTPRQQIVYTPRAFHALTADEASSIELPFSGFGVPAKSEISVFNITNVDTDGGAISAVAPKWGVIGMAGNTTPYPGVRAPAGVLGVGEGSGVSGSSPMGIGVYGVTINGTSGEFAVLLDNPGNALQAHTSGPGHAGIFRKTRTTGAVSTILVENDSSTLAAIGVHSIITPTRPLRNRCLGITRRHRVGRLWLERRRTRRPLPR